MKTIVNSGELATICQRLRQAEFVTVDTEFLRDSTYFAKLCLVQVADDIDAHAIDPLASGLDMAPFWDLMFDESVLKVMHASRQDMEIFYKDGGKLPSPVFDTQLAAMVCGHGDSVGYETLVNKICDKRLDKSSRYTDWSRRPLSDRQITYAIGDVTHLRDIYRRLAADLASNGRQDWLSDEMDILNNPQTYFVEPSEAWRRIRMRSNKARFVHIVQALAQWREEEAITRDMPRNRIAKDETLLEIAAHPPSDIDDLDRIRGLSRNFGKSKSGQSLLASVSAAIATPDDQLPSIEKSKPRPPTPPMADLLKVLLKIRCQDAGVASRLIANAADVEAFAAQPHLDYKFSSGWRYDLFGKDAAAMLRGDLALGAKGGDIAVVPVDHSQD